MDAVVAILATLIAGGSYVPLDPEQPRARLDALAERGQLGGLIGEGGGCVEPAQPVGDLGGRLGIVGPQARVARPDAAGPALADSLGDGLIVSPGLIDLAGQGGVVGGQVLQVLLGLAGELAGH